MDDQERMELRPKYGKVVCRLLTWGLGSTGSGPSPQCYLPGRGATGRRQQFSWGGRVSVSFWEDLHLAQG